MIKKVTIGDVRITCSIARVTQVIGVNSRISDDRHIIMWDFDDTSRKEVEAVLRHIQYVYNLSDVYLLETKPLTNYIAYCFTALPFKDVCRVILATSFVDWNFIKYGIYRGRFTLRVTPKEERQPVLVKILLGFRQPDVKVTDLTSWVKYQTLKG